MFCFLDYLWIPGLPTFLKIILYAPEKQTHRPNNLKELSLFITVV